MNNILLTTEEAQYIYDHLEGDDPIKIDIIIKMIIAIPKIEIGGCPF